MPRWEFTTPGFPRRIICAALPLSASIRSSGGRTGWFRASSCRCTRRSSRADTGLVYQRQFFPWASMLFSCRRFRTGQQRLLPSILSTKLGAGRFITQRKRTPLPARSRSSRKKIRAAGYDRTLNADGQPRRPPIPGTHENWFRFGGGYHHAAAYVTEPRRFCRAGALRAARLGRWQKVAFTNFARFSAN